MAIDLAFRRRAVRKLTNEIGCYVLCDLDGVPIYVGQSVDGIRARVNRHLTSARSDIFANRQIDVWEIAWVWTCPVENRNEIAEIEAALFHQFQPRSPLMNGKVPRRPSDAGLTLLATKFPAISCRSQCALVDAPTLRARLPIRIGS